MTKPEKVCEHPGRVLRICWKEIHGIPFCLLICLETIDLDKLFFHRRLVQPEIKQIFGEFAVILQSIGAFTIAKRLVEALAVMSQLNCALGQHEAILMPLKRQLVALKALVQRIFLPLFSEMDL